MTVTTTSTASARAARFLPRPRPWRPGQRALVYQTPGERLWREGTQSWTMEIVLQTTKGETYRNTLSWK